MRVICVTGAESSGKTTLAEQLTEALGAVLVPEVARSELTPGTRYTQADVERIGHLQADREAEALSASSGWVVADTDLLVIRVWLEVGFDAWPDSLAARHAARPPRLYVLCAPDFPWQPDPLREHPNERDALHARYRTHLQAMEDPMIEVFGSTEARVSAVLERLHAE